MDEVPQNHLLCAGDIVRVDDEDELWRIKFRVSPSYVVVDSQGNERFIGAHRVQLATDRGE